jgi:hypothetical protein
MGIQRAARQGLQDPTPMMSSDRLICCESVVVGGITVGGMRFKDCWIPPNIPQRAFAGNPRTAE